MQQVIPRASAVKKGAVFAGILAAVAIAACSQGSTAATPNTPVVELQDPTSCANCHSQHYAEWAASMHAYSSDDPIFLAMQKRAQRETNGAIGTFCVNCHAPIAAREGLTTDGSNLASLPAPKRGVTCYFCHSVTATTDTHNNALTLAADGTMRADIMDPAANSFHSSAYSALHDGEQLGASALCGTCHDLTTQAGVALETSFAEWKQSLFAHDVAGQKLTCQGCHMPGSDGNASNVAGSPARRVHDHSMPAVDVATTIPVAMTQQPLVQSNLDPALVVKMCVRPPQQGDTVEITLDNAFVGHNFPSGAAHDRRVWLELIGYQGANQIYQTGVVQDGMPLPETTDPNLWLFDEKLTDANGKPVLFMWQATANALTALPYAVTADPDDPAYYHAKTKTFAVPPTADKITMRVRMAPFAAEVLSALVTSGDLDPSIPAKVPTYTLAGSVVTWTKDLGFTCLPM